MAVALRCRFLPAFVKNASSCGAAQMVAREGLLTRNDATSEHGVLWRHIATERNGVGLTLVGRNDACQQLQVVRAFSQGIIHIYPVNIFVKTVLNIDSDVWKMAGEKESILLTLIKKGIVYESLGAKDVNSFSNSVLDEYSPGSSALHKPTILILMFAILLHPTKFGSTKVKTVLGHIFLDRDSNFERFTEAELALISAALTKIGCPVPWSPANVKCMFVTLNGLLSSQRIAKYRTYPAEQKKVTAFVNSILKDFKPNNNVPIRYRAELMETWNSLDSDACFLKRRGHIWGLLTILFEGMPKDAVSFRFTLDLKKFLYEACDEQVRRAEIKEGYESSAAVNMPKYFLRTQDFGHCFRYLRKDSARLGLLTVDGDDNDHCDMWARYVTLRFRVFRDHPEYLNGILISMAVAGYYPRVLMEKAWNDAFVLQRAFELARADFNFGCGATCDSVNKLFADIKNVIQGASSRLFREGKVYRVQPDLITDRFADSRLPAEVKLLVITLFAVGTNNAGQDSGRTKRTE